VYAKAEFQFVNTVIFAISAASQLDAKCVWRVKVVQGIG